MNKVVHRGVLGLLLLLGAGCCFDIKNLDVLVSLDPVVLPFSHILFSSHSFFLPPIILWQPGPSGPAEGVSFCAEGVGDGRFDSHTEV